MGDSILLCHFFVEEEEVFDQIFVNISQTTQLGAACMIHLQDSGDHRAGLILEKAGLWQFKVYNKAFEEYVVINDGEIPRGVKGFPVNAKVQVRYSFIKDRNKVSNTQLIVSVTSLQLLSFDYFYDMI